MLKARQEKFVQNIFAGMTQYDAYVKAGYKHKTKMIANANACRLLQNPNLQNRLGELHERSASRTIMSVQERKERLTEIARARLTDYQEAGADGAGYINIGKESPNTAAIAGIKSATKFDENGNTGTLFTEVRLHNPVVAIAELNKMERLYADEHPSIIDNRSVNIFNFSTLSDEELKALEQIVIKATPQLRGDSAGEIT